MKILVGALHANNLDNLEWFNVHYESFPYGSMFVMGEEGAGNRDWICYMSSEHYEGYGCGKKDDAVYWREERLKVFA